jgi:hypothetical protein
MIHVLSKFSYKKETRTKMEKKENFPGLQKTIKRTNFHQTHADGLY